MRFYTEEAPVEPDFNHILTQFRDKGNIKVDWIEKIRNHDIASKTSLEKTVIAYVENGFNAKEASAVLFIHHNSMKERFNKISLITGVELTPKNILAMYFAFQCKKVFQTA